MPKSVELIKAEKSRDFLACIDRKTEKMSDFEKFAFVCENLYLMVGSALRQQFITALREDIGEELDLVQITDREVQKKLWKKAHGERITVFDTRHEKNDEVFPQGLCDEFIPPILNSLLKNREDLPEDIDGFISKLPHRFAIDTSQMEYLRPNEYNSALAYEKILNGYACDKGELCALLCWIACRAAMRNAVDIYLICGENMSIAEAIVALLEGRKLYPNVRLCFYPEDKNAVDMAVRICLCAAQKNISSEIIIPEEKIALENIERLFWQLPAARISLCGFLTRENGREQFRKAFKLMAAEK